MITLTRTDRVIDNRADHRPRVAILDHTAALGGGEIALLELVRRLDRSRIDLTVILFAPGPLCGKLSEAGVPWQLLQLSQSVTDTRKGSLGIGLLLRVSVALAAARFVLRLARHLRSEKYALIHTNSLKSDLLGGFAGRLAGVPVLWHVRDRIEPDYLPTLMVRLFRGLAHFLPSQIVANSNATLSTLRLRTPGGARQSPEPWFRTIHDGTRTSEEQPWTPADGPAAPIVGLVGRISPWKGQHIFIQAAAEVLKHHPDAQFQIIGSALFDEIAYEGEVRQLAAELGITKSIHFLGFRSDVRKLISQLRILVHASTTGEPFGQVIIEGMAEGRPVVATNGGGVPEIVVDGVTGILVPMGDSRSMANAILRVLGDPSLAASMGSAGRQRVQQSFRIERTADEMMQVYDRMLAIHGKSDSH